MNPTEAVKLLQALGWTQARIAAKVETTQPTIYKIAHGRRPNYELGLALVKLGRRHAGKLKPESESV